MGRVSTCQKNCKTIGLRGAQVNNTMYIHTRSVTKIQNRVIHRQVTEINIVSNTANAISKMTVNTMTLAFYIVTRCCSDILNMGVHVIIFIMDEFLSIIKQHRF